MRALAFAVVLLAAGMGARFAPAAGASTDSSVGSAEENFVSERLASRAVAVLDGMLGPGRAKVLVEVRGERLQIRTETAIAAPSAEKGSAGAHGGEVTGALRFLDLPGYFKARGASAAQKAAGALQTFPKYFEHRLRDAGFEIKKIEATVVLDSALSEVSAREAAQLLAQLLRIDGSRGDVLSIVRAPLRPAWRMAFCNPDDWRSLAFVASGLFVAVLIGMIFAAAFVRGARVFAVELSSRRIVGDLGGAVIVGGEPLPELMPGSPGGLVLVGGESEGPPDAAAAARALALETPADLAQFFAHLAKTDPETATRLFSKLPADVQAAASAILLQLKAVDPNRLSKIKERLEERL